MLSCSFRLCLWCRTLGIECSCKAEAKEEHTATKKTLKTCTYPNNPDKDRLGALSQLQDWTTLVKQRKESLTPFQCGSFFTQDVSLPLCLRWPQCYTWKWGLTIEHHQRVNNSITPHGYVRFSSQLVRSDEAFWMAGEVSYELKAKPLTTKQQFLGSCTI